MIERHAQEFWMIDTHVILTPRHTRELEELAELAPTSAPQRAIPFVARLAREYATTIGQRLREISQPGPPGAPYVAQQIEGPGGAWWLGFFAWPPGAATPIHDHTGWGVYSCAGGLLLEERYRRLDDGTQPNRARLRLDWQRRWRRGDSSGLLPYAGGIHRVANPGPDPAFSVHLYGPRMGPFDGRDYDPTRDYVCDRPV